MCLGLLCCGFLVQPPLIDIPSRIDPADEPPDRRGAALRTSDQMRPLQNVPAWGVNSEASGHSREALQAATFPQNNLHFITNLPMGRVAVMIAGVPTHKVSGMTAVALSVTVVEDLRTTADSHVGLYREAGSKCRDPVGGMTCGGIT